MVLDRLIAEDKIREMIVVMPDANTTFMGNWYVNSPVLGNYQDYITDELVQHIDENYRTLAHRESRGIGGHSMGGFGAINLGMHHSEIYSAVYGHESAALKFEEFSPRPFAWQEGNPQNFDIFTRKDWDAFQKAGPFAKVEFLTPATFSPNLDNPPFYGNWLWIKDGEQLKRDSATWQRWKAFDPTDLVEIQKENLCQLRALKFDGGTESGQVTARPFHEALTEADIPHEFEVFTGGHFDCTASRMESVILPFFSELLASN
jgi:S-formylglutathione hydrolase FrmB